MTWNTIKVRIITGDHARLNVAGEEEMVTKRVLFDWYGLVVVPRGGRSGSPSPQRAQVSG